MITLHRRLRSDATKNKRLSNVRIIALLAIAVALTGISHDRALSGQE